MLGLSLRGAWAAPAALAPGVLDGRTDVAAAYGTRRLLSAHGLGPAFDLIRGSDGATATVGFNAAGDPTLVGSGTLADWLGSGGAKVSRWYDQTGAGNHATQATVNNQPGLRLGSRIGMAPSIIFNGQFISDLTPGGGTNFKWLVIPDTLTGLSSTSLTLLAVTRSLAFNRQGGIVQLHQAARASNTPPVNLVRASSDQAVGLVGYGPSGVNWSQFGPSNRQMLMNPQAVAYACAAAAGAGTYVQHWDGANAPATGGPWSSVALAGGLIGAWQQNPTLLPAMGASSGFEGEIGAVVVLNQAIAPAAATALRGALTDDFGATPAFTPGIGSLLFMGDSITEGTGSTFGQTVPRRVEQLGLAVSPRLYAGGRFAGTLATNVRALWATYTALAVPGARNVLLFSAGTNDIAGGATAATVFGADDAAGTTPDTIRRVVASGRAQGWTMLVGTLVGRGYMSAAAQAERASLNALIRDGAATHGYAVVDYAAIPQLAANPVFGNPHYLADLVHPNDAGYALMAPVAQAAVNAAFAA
ncbi:SGNH/GDSL hydrolase family protein [Roseicella aquatilis]|uniref:SGNH hydrolase-type esterase domain-containing protein n=1 Tax=Roseicella aquatilis TaxID=2527868 RepID=A0A4R4DLP3_9PROT|nr:SGNH/GDSL hydrolase family protein [Roseicella aquatilis]TCZ60947.1 hypothetical protein EXY23_14355 [Roseicella aquatilis]